MQVPWDKITLTLQTDASLLMCDVQREDCSQILEIKTDVCTCCFVQTKCKLKCKSEDSVGAWLACSRSGHFPVQVITDDKGTSALFFCPLILFFFPLYFFFFFLRTDFLRELLTLRAFYPDISDNDVTTQVHLLLFFWKLTEAKGLMDNGHIFQQHLMYM